MTFSFRSATLFICVAVFASCTPAPKSDGPETRPPETGGLTPGEIPPPIIIAPAPEVVVEPEVFDEPQVIAEPAFEEFEEVEPEAMMVEESAATTDSVQTINREIEDGKYSEVTLFFATNRERQATFNPREPATMFGKNNASEVTYGTALVSIPDTHQPGEVESQSWIESILSVPNKEEFVILQNMIPRSEANTFAMVDSILETQDAILLYVHGFNTSLEKAARRSGQMTFDLKWNGPSFFFSWPSQAQPWAYTIDQTMAERSERALIEVLTKLTKRDKAKRIVVIAHSMGTHVMTQALLRLHAANPDAARRITTIVLAAPDIDADLFVNDILPVFDDMPGTDVTLYASSKDTALSASHAVNGFPRIGDTEFGDDPLSPISVVDASAAESNFFDHTYYGDNPRIIEDIAGVVRDQIEPKDRDTLEGVPFDDGPTWKFINE